MRFQRAGRIVIGDSVALLELGHGDHLHSAFRHRHEAFVASEGDCLGQRVTDILLQLAARRPPLVALGKRAFDRRLLRQIERLYFDLAAIADLPRNAVHLHPGGQECGLRALLELGARKR